MTLEKTLWDKKKLNGITIAVEYLPHTRTVIEILGAFAETKDGRHRVNITEILNEHDELENMVDRIDWPEIAAEEMQPPCEDDDEEGWRE
jgi:hypothetical protein